MRNGFSLPELAIGLAICALLLGMGLPRLAGTLDWVATDRAARDITTAIAVARATAVAQDERTRVTIVADSLRIDWWDGDTWRPRQAWPGPDGYGVALEVSNPEIVFIPLGMAWGVSNTRVVLRRGTRVETITVSRLGRVKRW
jgi:prepilin-type N-terminal cleavage/methylation domain-containing protein